MRILRDIYSTQAAGTRFCLQIGTTAYLFGNNGKDYCDWMLQLFTPFLWFRWSSHRRIEKRRKANAKKHGWTDTTR